MNATDLDPAALLDALHAALDADPSDVPIRSGRDHACGGCGRRWVA